MRSDRVSGSGESEPVGVLFEHGEETLEPAVGIAELVGPGPDTELLEIVAHGREAAGVPEGGVAQEFRRLGLIAERDQISQRLQAGKKFHRVAEIFGEAVAVELVEIEAGAKEVVVVHKRVFDARRGKRRRDRRLPNALREPRAARPRAEMLFDVIGEAHDLLVAIVRRNGRQDRLVESAARDFHLAALHESAETVEIFRVRALDPFEQRPGIMEAHANRGMPRENFDER